MHAHSECCITDCSSRGHRRREKVADFIGKLAWGRGWEGGLGNQDLEQPIPSEVTNIEGWAESGERFARHRAWRKEGGKEERRKRGRKQRLFIQEITGPFQCAE